ncbi:MAG: acyl carrier protein [Alphaproteobacteria bacterium]|nr:MAG: acyl carrier protein [Alphaproteobacteria bacterium]
MTVEAQMRDLLGDVLQLGSRAQALRASSGLLGSLPELDSMAVASVLTGIEETFGIVIEDDEISAEIFETFGSLCDFVAQKQLA